MSQITHLKGRDEQFWSLSENYWQPGLSHATVTLGRATEATAATSNTNNRAISMLFMTNAPIFKGILVVSSRSHSYLAEIDRLRGQALTKKSTGSSRHAPTRSISSMPRLAKRAIYKMKGNEIQFVMFRSTKKRNCERPAEFGENGNAIVVDKSVAIWRSAEC